MRSSRLLVLALSSVLVGVGCGAARPAGPPPPPATPAGTRAHGDDGEPKPAIVQIGAPVLRARAAEVPPEQISTPEMQALFARMIDTMRKAPGVGLAGPQIGVGLRVIVLEDRPELMAKLTPLEVKERERVAFGPRVFVNPVVTPIGTEKATFFEVCLSVRGYVGLVERYTEVEVSGLDEHGVRQTWRVHGWPARILQHELDHIDGTVYVDRMLTRSFSTADQAKERFSGKPIAEVRRALGVDP